MLSMSTIHGTHLTTALATQSTLIHPNPHHCFLPPKPKPKPFFSFTISCIKAPSRPPRTLRPSAPFAAAEALETSNAAVEAGVEEETPPPSSEEEKERLGVVVKTMEKPRLVLKFIWMEKNIGLGLDQAIPGHGTLPLSPYYFWPRKDAWEELKSLLESKPWISQKRMIILLNQATDIINLWQQSGGTV